MRTSLLLAPRLAPLVLAAVVAHAADPAGVPTDIEDPGHRGLSVYYLALRAAEAGDGVARAVHYGDSTIAADGIARTVRGRLQARFGDAGPGFVSAALDPRWNIRKDVTVRKRGEWTMRTILLGGADGRYGLGGVVAVARPGVSATVGALDAAERPVQTARAEVWYQAGVGYGTVLVRDGDREVGRASAAAEATTDRWLAMSMTPPSGALTVTAESGPVPLYGLVLETGQPGATWESLGVIGVGSKSFRRHDTEAFSAQMAHRDPDLIVIQLGGNEAGYPVLRSGDGSGYKPIFEEAVRTIRAGAPDASCLVVTPPDQAEVPMPDPPPDDGVDDTDEAAVPPPEPLGPPRTKPGMPRLVAVQREVAAEAGCAFWSSYDAMGGAGSLIAWTKRRPALAFTDWVHLSPAGQAALGDLLADAILRDYEAWRGQQ